METKKKYPEQLQRNGKIWTLYHNVLTETDHYKHPEEDLFVSADFALNHRMEFSRIPKLGEQVFILSKKKIADLQKSINASKADTQNMDLNIDLLLAIQLDGTQPVFIEALEILQEIEKVIAGSWQELPEVRFLSVVDKVRELSKGLEHLESQETNSQLIEAYLEERISELGLNNESPQDEGKLAAYDSLLDKIKKGDFKAPLFFKE